MMPPVINDSTRVGEMWLENQLADCEPVKETSRPVVCRQDTLSAAELAAEFVAADEVLSGIRPAVSIYGSARTPADDPLYALCEGLARRLSDAGFAVLSGGGPGIMEAANKGAFGGRSQTVGLNIVLPHEQKPNDYQDVSVCFDSLLSRKAMFIKHSLAWVVLPGGFGTLDELFETLTLVQTGKTPFRPLILMGSGFWGGLVDWLRAQLLERAYVSAADMDLIRVCDCPDEVVQSISAYYRRYQETCSGCGDDI